VRCALWHAHAQFYPIAFCFHLICTLHKEITALMPTRGAADLLLATCCPPYGAPPFAQWHAQQRSAAQWLLLQQPSKPSLLKRAAGSRPFPCRAWPTRAGTSGPRSLKGVIAHLELERVLDQGHLGCVSLAHRAHSCPHYTYCLALLHLPPWAPSLKQTT